jgi:hypothetical protein
MSCLPEGGLKTLDQSLKSAGTSNGEIKMMMGNLA